MWFREGDAPPALLLHPAAGDPAATARALFAAKNYDAVAALYGPLDRPTILVGRRGDRAAGYLTALAGEALADERLGSARPRVAATAFVVARPPCSATAVRYSS